MSSFVEIRDLRKSYGDAEVLKGIDLTFNVGEIHAFLGANGAGKSTLLGCLSGAISPSSGVIQVNGKNLSHLTPRKAHELGIGIIYQHFQVVEGLSVADNIFLGNEILRHGIINRKEQNRQARDYLSRLKLEIDPSTPLEKLSIGERQLIEIARALRQSPKVLILDEPTAALSSREMKALHEVVRHLAREEGLAIVYVTHLIDEVEQIADRVSILRDGRMIWTRPVTEVSHEIITNAIAPFLTGASTATPLVKDAPVVLSLQGYHSGFSGPVDVQVRAGEIVGLYGLLGSGRTDLLESLIGARSMKAGIFRMNGQEIRPSGPNKAQQKGVALVAADRPEQGLFGELTALENLLMPHFGSIAGGRKKQRKIFDDIARRVQLRPDDPELAGSRFSGGNAQKIMIGRWLVEEANVRLLLLDEPTQGVDVGAREELYGLLRDFTAAGGAILVSSSDPEELVTLAHRVLIMARGKQSAVIESEITEEKLIRLAHQAAVHSESYDIVT